MSSRRVLTIKNRAERDGLQNVSPASLGAALAVRSPTPGMVWSCSTARQLLRHGLELPLDELHASLDLPNLTTGLREDRAQGVGQV